MTLFILAFLGGILTILSPCVLPVLPFVFSNAGRPFGNGGLSLLTGMALHSPLSPRSLRSVADGSYRRIIMGVSSPFFFFFFFFFF